MGHGKPLKDFNCRGNKFSSVFLNGQLHNCLENEVEKNKGGIRIISQEVTAIHPQGK